MAELTFYRITRFAIFAVMFGLLCLVDRLVHKPIRWRYNLTITLTAMVLTQFTIWLLGWR